MVEPIRHVKNRHRGDWFRRTTAMTRRIPAYAFSGRGGIYFVTCDALSKFDRNRYTIRVLRDDGSIGCYGGYRAYGSRARADFIAKSLADKL